MPSSNDFVAYLLVDFLLVDIFHKRLVNIEVQDIINQE